jgi:hypothetical protein
MEYLNIRKELNHLKTQNTKYNSQIRLCQRIAQKHDEVQKIKNSIKDIVNISID